MYTQNKYTVWYFKLVARIKNNNRMLDQQHSYYERHHIHPRSLFPAISSLRRFPENGLLVTSREHFILHKLLTKMIVDENNNRKMRYAFSRMTRRACTSRSYHDATLHIVNSLSYKNNRKRVNQSKKGRAMADTTKSKISEALKGIKKSDEHKHNIKRAKASPDYRANISQKLKGRPKTDSHINSMKAAKTSEEYREKMAKAFSKHWLVIHPDGTKYYITNLRKYSLEHGFNDWDAKGRYGSRGYKAFLINEAEV